MVVVAAKQYPDCPNATDESVDDNGTACIATPVNVHQMMQVPPSSATYTTVYCT